MEYKILINSKGVPVLVEVPEKPIIGCFEKHFTHRQREICKDTRLHQCSCADWDEALSAALADESKHIPISQSDHNDLGINWNTAKIGDLYDLPDWYKITTTKSYKVSLTLNEIKPESVPSQQAKIHKSEIVQKVLDNITPEEMAETERKMMEESVLSCGEPRMYSKDELLHALNIGFVAGRSKQTFESFQKEAMEFYETPTKH